LPAAAHFSRVWYPQMTDTILGAGLEAMGRREFTKLLGSAAVTWLSGAHAQQAKPVRRIGVFTNLAADDPESQARLGAFVQGLQQLDWAIGSNVRIDYRWGTTDIDRYRQYAAELVALSPDVILAVAGAAVTAVQQATHDIPIVFVGSIDPVGSGLVASLARPGGNATGRRMTFAGAARTFSD
jgi:ABC-type uncharacterized transport system substrate-binding protein